MKKTDIIEFKNWFNRNSIGNISDRDIDNFMQYQKSISTIESRKAKFANQVGLFRDKYPREMLCDFFSYWSEHGENDRKFRKEKQTSFDISKRLARWAKNYKPKKQESVQQNLQGW